MFVFIISVGTCSVYMFLIVDLRYVGRESSTVLAVVVYLLPSLSVVTIFSTARRIAGASDQFMRFYNVILWLLASYSALEPTAAPRVRFLKMSLTI
jgi:hypothetical protein